MLSWKRVARSRDVSLEAWNLHENELSEGFLKGRAKSWIC